MPGWLVVYLRADVRPNLHHRQGVSGSVQEASLRSSRDLLLLFPYFYAGYTWNGLCRLKSWATGVKYSISILPV